MTEEQILEYFKDINHAYNDCTRYDTLKRMLDELQEPCEDAISREAVLKIIDGWYEQNRDTDNIEDLIVLITYMDSVNSQKPKTGHWIFVDEAKEHARCSECGYGDVDLFNGKPHNYCEKCGVKMESEVQS